MKKFITDMHTHSTYSFDGRSSLEDMLSRAREMGLDFYGVSEHFNYDYVPSKFRAEDAAKLRDAIPEEYFGGGRRLQEAYAGVMNVLVGAELGYADDVVAQKRYQALLDEFSLDYVINSVHCADGADYARYTFTADKAQTYGQYLGLIRRSLDAPYAYDIVGHIGYIARYVPFEDKSFTGFEAQIDDILETIIKKDKILEVNSSNKKLLQRTLPAENIVRRYYELGGRKVSFGSDAHDVLRIADKREEIMETLKKIGFTYIVVPCRGEHIKVEI